MDFFVVSWALHPFLKHLPVDDNSTVIHTHRPVALTLEEVTSGRLVRRHCRHAQAPKDCSGRPAEEAPPCHGAKLNMLGRSRSQRRRRCTQAWRRRPCCGGRRWRRRSSVRLDRRGEVHRNGGHTKALPSMLAKEFLREGGSVICNIRRKICSMRRHFSTRVWMCMQEAGHIELVASRARARAWKDRTSTSATTDGARLARRWIKQVLPLAAASVDGNGVAAPKLCGQCSTLVSQSWVLASREVREVTQSETVTAREGVRHASLRRCCCVSNLRLLVSDGAGAGARRGFPSAFREELQLLLFLDAVVNVQASWRNSARAKPVCHDGNSKRTPPRDSAKASAGTVFLFRRVKKGFAKFVRNGVIEGRLDADPAGRSACRHVHWRA